MARGDAPTSRPRRRPRRCRRRREEGAVTRLLAAALMNQLLRVITVIYWQVRPVKA